MTRIIKIDADLLGAVIKKLLTWTLLQPLPTPRDYILGYVGQMSCRLKGYREKSGRVWDRQTGEGIQTSQILVYYGCRPWGLRKQVSMLSVSSPLSVCEPEQFCWWRIKVVITALQSGFETNFGSFANKVQFIYGVEAFSRPKCTNLRNVLCAAVVTTPKETSKWCKEHILYTFKSLKNAFSEVYSLSTVSVAYREFGSKRWKRC